ncbi:hypothetical protein GCM10025777_30280 [Membranihabitans marinus]
MNGSLLDRAHISFEFRGQQIQYHNDNGTFEYIRNFQDTSANLILDSLNNEGFSRYMNNEKLNLTSEEETSLAGGINSIIYFAFLPYALTDPAVNSSYIGEVNIKNKTYHKVQITFDQEGGGEDHDDVFLYFFDIEDYSLDYLAYSYHVHGGGIRFRAGYNERNANGLIYRDYINYKADPNTIDFDMIEEAYENGHLEELSKIEIENLTIHSSKE